MSHEGLPEQNPYTRELMSLLALQLNVHEMHGQARRENDKLIASMSESQRMTTQRYIMIDYPGQKKPASEQIIPTRCERVVLLPDPNDYEHVKQVIVRLPVAAKESRTGRLRELRNAFIEIVDVQHNRVNFLLNDQGLWRYNSVEDLVSSDNENFSVLGTTTPEPGETVEILSRYIAESAYGQQTRFDDFND